MIYQAGARGREIILVMHSPNHAYDIGDRCTISSSRGQLRNLWEGRTGPGSYGDHDGGRRMNAGSTNLNTVADVNNNGKGGSVND